MRDRWQDEHRPLTSAERQGLESVVKLSGKQWEQILRLVHDEAKRLLDEGNSQAVREYLDIGDTIIKAKNRQV